MLSWWKRTPQQGPRIQQLWVYPIKSCRGTRLDESAYGEEGLEYDRQWMIVDAATHRFLTARTIPRMLLIHPSINRNTDSLDITVPSSSSTSTPSTFSVPLAHPATYLSDPKGDESLDHDYTVFGCEPQDGYSVGSPELIAALSEFMGRDVLLIRKGLTRRSVKEVPGVVHSEGLDPVLGFADFYAFQISSATSLNELTTRIPSLSTDPSFNQTRWSPSALSTQGGLEIARFRPNIVIEGLKEAWEEDGWKKVRFAEGEEVEVGMKCGRCQVPSYDPATGVRDKLLPDAVMKDRVVQPLSAPKVCFGVLASPLKKQGGRLKVGDAVTVLEAYPKSANGVWVRNEDRVN
ncbi:MOSC N-terminal beta barrel domain-domain containing protein [Rhodotorula toruloides]|uniref:MOSC N-terminal beta barrel domain-domain containing protein n=1 Tax=Rhodotorula toruloides TaxID=5286 RepID=A0A2T0A0G5_RHOTO|nr:MOSC N-terminal beta barrel domain-domain containing protein [Rhodotorula toruloides]PRQ71489.1 MOSC N-terminal beta barrel domain-domain containing protein [Rhodotorula toruloides]